MIVSNDIVSSVTIENRAEFGVKSFDIFKIGTLYLSYDYDEKSLLKKEAW
ncbi:MAG: hypothetical protein LBF13_04555 [Campylobacteraceae bacterium]|jgi:hypothetical protein|nr:hypothetical protein [Campylobacteraceae bacterium]